MTNKKYLLCLAFFLLCVSHACDNSEKTSYDRGDIISSSSMIIYAPNDIEQIMAANNFPGTLAPSNSVEALKIVYQTVDTDGNFTQASGAVFVPLNTGNKPLLSLHHGTVTGRDEVASVNPLNSVEGTVGLITASLGYFTCVPDFLGFGDSDISHPYFHAQSLATAIIDFIRATRIYCSENDIAMNEQLFLAGYSEGGYATLAAQKEIETNYSEEFQLTAVAPMAGPYDLSGTTDSIFQDLTYSYPIYPAFLLTSYNEIYGWDRLDEIFNPPFADMMPDLFDGTKSYGKILNSLPTTIPELLNQNFITDYINGSEIEVRAALEENTLLNWTPSTTIRFYHGDADQVAPYYNALNVVDNLKVNGGVNIDLVTIIDGTHETSGLPAIIGMIEWFNSFRNVSFR